ncbi:hypothetical protein ACVZP5_004967, partial [Escherichia coli]
LSQLILPHFIIAVDYGLRQIFRLTLNICPQVRITPLRLFRLCPALKTLSFLVVDALKMKKHASGRYFLMSVRHG